MTIKINYDSALLYSELDKTGITEYIMNKWRLFKILVFISVNRFGGTVRDSKLTIASIAVKTGMDKCHVEGLNLRDYILLTYLHVSAYLPIN